MKRPDRPVARGLAAFAAIAATAGVVVSVYLSFLKYGQVTYRCVSEVGCSSAGDAGCAVTLTSAWSEVLGLPLSLWATGLYVVVIVAALMLVRRPPTSGPAPHLLLGLACIGVLASLTMAGYSAHLGALCRLCGTLHAINGLLLVAAILLYRQACADGCEQWRRTVSRPGAVLDAWFFASMVFVGATGVQAIFYQVQRRLADPDAGCPVARQPLPETTLISGALDPEVVVAVFVDPSCTHCRRMHERISGLFAEGRLAHVQLRLFHYPQEVCDLGARPGSVHNLSVESQQAGACLASMAVECADQLVPGSGVPLLVKLFDHQFDPPQGQPLFTGDNVRESVQWLRAEQVPVPSDEALIRCINDGTALERIAVQQAYVDGLGVKKLPLVVKFPVRDGMPDVASAQYIGSDRSREELVRLLAPEGAR